jgi:uncharacterized membrane protein YfcA
MAAKLVTVKSENQNMNAGQIGGMVGIVVGILGAVVGVLGGVVGTYFSIKNTKSPRERAFMIQASIVCWVFVLAFVLGVCLIPGFYKILLVPIYVVGLVAGILLGNRKQAKIRSEESQRAV